VTCLKHPNEACDCQAFFTPEQLVARWGGAVTLVTLKTWRSRGRGPMWTTLGPGGRVVYPLRVVEDWEVAHFGGVRGGR